MEVISAVKIISCVLTLIGSLSIILSYILFPSLRGRGREYLCYLSISDIGTGISYLIILHPTAESSGTLCNIQSLLGMFFPISSFCWTICLAYYMYILVRDLIPDNANSNKLRYAFHIISWSLPTITCIIIAATGTMGYSKENENSGGWCWVKENEKLKIPIWIWELLGGKLIEIICVFILCPLFYYLINKNLKSIPKISQNDDIELSKLNENIQLNNRSNSKNKNNKNPSNQYILIFYKKLVLIPIVFMICRIWGTIHTFLPAHPTWLSYFQAFFDPLQGFFNGIIFVLLSSNCREEYMKLFKCKNMNRRKNENPLLLLNSDNNGDTSDYIIEPSTEFGFNESI